MDSSLNHGLVMHPNFNPLCHPYYYAITPETDPVLLRQPLADLTPRMTWFSPQTDAPRAIPRPPITGQTTMPPLVPPNELPPLAWLQ
jgi:hypothetical protein